MPLVPETAILEMCCYGQTDTIGRKKRVQGCRERRGRKGSRECWKKRKEEMTSFLRNGAVIANCNRLYYY